MAQSNFWTYGQIGVVHVNLITPYSSYLELKVWYRHEVVEMYGCDCELAITLLEPHYSCCLEPKVLYRLDAVEMSDCELKESFM